MVLYGSLAICQHVSEVGRCDCHSEDSEAQKGQYARDRLVIRVNVLDAEQRGDTAKDADLSDDGKSSHLVLFKS